MAISTLPTSTQLREDGYSVTVTVTNMLGASWPVVIADITDTPEGSAIRYYQSQLGYGAYKEAMMKCQ